jgi:hypothetical protein
MSNEARVPDIPVEAFDGSWWSVPAFVEVKCPKCERITWDRPAVMRYREGLDWLDEAKRLEPLWVERGWRAWWSCSACGHEWWSDKGGRIGTDSNYVTNETIERWISDFRELMKWRQH